MPAIALSPQCAAILAELRSGPRTTLDLTRSTGVLSVGPRIHELRVALQLNGLAIDTALVEVRNRHKQRVHVARYSLRCMPRSRSKRATAKRRA